MLVRGVESATLISPTLFPKPPYHSLKIAYLVGKLTKQDLNNFLT